MIYTIRQNTIIYDSVQNTTVYNYTVNNGQNQITLSATSITDLISQINAYSNWKTAPAG